MHWEILGLSCDTDERALKRVYAALIKKHSPEADPEGFKRINSAYKAAMAELKGGIKAENPVVPTQPAADNDGFDFSTVSGQKPEPEKEYSMPQIQSFILKDLKALTDSQCTDLSKWDRIFNTCEFDELVSMPDFRSKAADIFYGEKYTEPVAQKIAAAFGGGSRAVVITYPERLCEMDITPCLNNVQKRPHSYSADENYEHAYRHGNYGSNKKSILTIILYILLIPVALRLLFYLAVIFLAAISGY